MCIIFLFLKIRIIIKKVNILTFILYHEIFDQIGNVGLIQIEIIDDKIIKKFKLL